ncbi:hypothetical protein F5Y15DRAFT_81022 [Xylariaceae sp. FL0016]|nr:hypothetical protein F5Y15DRAFT_81022 [Xylariaceae sp. FL0016]
MATKQDYQVASLAFGFTIGFGFLTVWEAIKQTRRNKNPLRSLFIYMIWGEIAANLGIGIMGWLFLDGILQATVPVFFFILSFWVLEIQLLMQMIINRIAVISESQKTIRQLKWGTFGFISIINIMVFCIFIPAHLQPPPYQILYDINKYWDPASKVIICIVDAGLNWYFLRTVNKRLVKEHGLVKYQPLVSFNAKLMVLSIAMDVLLIGLMWLPNEIVFIQFHPVVYMVKLNIEMSMANLILRLARTRADGDYRDRFSNSNENGTNRDKTNHAGQYEREIALKSFNRATVKSNPLDSDSDKSADIENGISKTIDFHVSVTHAKSGESAGLKEKRVFDGTDDEISLTGNAGHPRAMPYR